jgi:hypothetical protein
MVRATFTLVNPGITAVEEILANTCKFLRGNRISSPSPINVKRRFPNELKRATEAKWHEKSIDPTLYGFQFQRGTRWNEGLADEMVTAYERVLRVRFPHVFRSLLCGMNGTDLATLNVYGSRDDPPRESVGVYSYPRDLERVKTQIEDIRASRAEITADLAEQGFELPAKANLVPVYIHRHVVCTSILNSSVVLSVVVNAADAIAYGNTLREYVEKEFLRD